MCSKTPSGNNETVLMRQNLNIKIKVEFSPIVHLKQRMKTLRKTKTELKQKNKDDVQTSASQPRFQFKSE